MLIITIKVNARPGQAIGIKEDLAMFLERYGDARVVSIEEVPQKQMEQMTIGGGVSHFGTCSQAGKFKRK